MHPMIVDAAALIIVGITGPVMYAIATRNDKCNNILTTPRRVICPVDKSIPN